MLGYGYDSASPRSRTFMLAAGAVLGLVLFVSLLHGSGASSSFGPGSSLGQLGLSYGWHSSTQQDNVEEAAALLPPPAAAADDEEENSYPPILVLSPLGADAIDDVPRFVDMLCRLSYPRRRLDLGFLVPEASQDEMIALLSEVTLCQGYSSGQLAGDVPAFRSVTYIIEPPPAPFPEAVRAAIEKDRHSSIGQVERRQRIARARNHLLTSMLGRVPDAEWVLHLDADIVSLTIEEPEGMTAINVPYIEKLLDYGRTGAMKQVLDEEEQAADIVAPNVLVNKPGTDDYWVYDWNSWISVFTRVCVFFCWSLADSTPVYAESDASRQLKATLKPEKVLFEGTMTTYHTIMAHLAEPWAGEEKVMELDGVGGNFLARASLHRQGAVFPSWPVDHQVESEGLGRIAKLMGARIVGLPNVIILHKKPTDKGFFSKTIYRNRPADTQPATGEPGQAKRSLPYPDLIKYRKRM